ncbi:group-specific protein [Halalkalibacter krulwichiae]|uniref:group-specific protein n=1 Tax=Halalkalibacter krulwichiae TaxID=199441 RepID=UPI001F17B040|nr:group-specific protein [Halalkalibacter krulwichiae]
MSHCKIDHPLEDVQRKLESQKDFLPADLYKRCEKFLTQPRSQSLLNELFHLLKKYDLASTEEKENRNQQLNKLV